MVKAPAGSRGSSIVTDGKVPRVTGADMVNRVKVPATGYGPGAGVGERDGAGMHGDEGQGGFGSGTQTGSVWRSRGAGQRRFNKGPKGYSRSDERIKEDISEQLMSEEGIDPSEVSIQVTGGVVVLEGTVPERHMKYIIEDIVDGCIGVQDVQNQLRVSRSGSEARRRALPH